MISVDLARRLRDSGLAWVPGNGDRFYIPDRGLDDRVFAISDMTVGIRQVADGPQISFNGAVEWALDAIMQREVIWLPTESQLRSMLGDRLQSLTRIADGFRCTVRIDGTDQSFDAAEAAEAYGLALLASRGAERPA